MNPNVPHGAAVLLDFIASVEAPKGYGTIYGNNQGKLPVALTSMTLDEVLTAQRGWSKNFGSSAAGRYQFMRATLKGLMTELGLRGSQHFNADLQDWLGYQLLKRRGYTRFIAAQLSLKSFALELAKEWASMPVLEDTQGAHRRVVRGQSYYAGDGLNKSLVQPQDFAAVLSEALNRPVAPPKPSPAPIPPAAPATPPAKRWSLLGALIALFLAIFGRKPK